MNLSISIATAVGEIGSSIVEDLLISVCKFLFVNGKLGGSLFDFWFRKEPFDFLLLFVGDECAFAQSKDFRWSIKVPELINWSNELVLFCSVCVIA